MIGSSKRTPRYPWSIPHKSPNPRNERNSFRKCWLRVEGLGKSLDLNIEILGLFFFNPVWVYHFFSPGWVGRTNHGQVGSFYSNKNRGTITLKLTAKTPQNRWLEDYRAKTNFQRLLTVSFRDQLYNILNCTDDISPHNNLDLTQPKDHKRKV